MNINRGYPEKVDQINLFEILNIFFKNIYLIIIITSIFAASSVFYALSKQNIYESTAILVVNEGSSKPSASLSGLSSMASLAGISLPSSGGVNKADLAIQTIKSREFFSHIISIDDVFVNLTSVDHYDPVLKKTIFDKTVYNPATKEWLLDSEGISQKPNFYKAYQDYLYVVGINYDKKTGFLYLSFQHQSPIFAKFFMDLIIDELNIIMKDKDLKQSTKAIEYLYDQLTNNSYSAINKSISGMIESNMYTKMMASIEKEYFITIVDKPFEPEFKIAPIRWLICILGTISGFIFSLLLCLFMSYSHLIYKDNKL